MLRLTSLTLSLAFLFVACATAPRTEEGRAELRADAEAALVEARAQSPELHALLSEAEGFAVFPRVGRGAAVVGAGYGRGVVYERGRVVGYADVTEGSAGLQLGGQRFTQFVVFEHSHALNRFKSDELAFDARASAVAIEAAAGTMTVFRDGVAVFVVDEQGLMVEAAIGGQRFRFIPI
jgi:lipid-binding SYLF domain-containing protein